MKLNFILIHSTGGNPDECWYPWLKYRLERKGHKVIIPRFPSPQGQTLKNWMKAFEPYWKEIDNNTIIIGRSIGSPFILRLLEKLNKPIKAAFLVAGFVSDIGMPDFEQYINSFIDNPFDFEKIKVNCKKFYVYHADDDPYVKLELGEEMAKELGTEVILIKGAGHFNLDTRYAEEFPELLVDIEKEL